MRQTNQNLERLRALLNKRAIDFFILPNADEFFSEYLPENKKRIQFLSDFSGSSATIIVTAEKCYFFTDGRYETQAKNQLDAKEYQIFNIAIKSVLVWLEENLQESQKLAFDGNIHSAAFAKKLLALTDKKSAQLEILSHNPIDEIWSQKPADLASKVYFLEESFSGVNSLQKRQNLTKNLAEDAVFLNCPASICWLLNIRAADVLYTPILLASAILYKNNDIDLFCDEARISQEDRQNLQQVNFIKPENLQQKVTTLKARIITIQIDPNSLNFSLYKALIENELTIKEAANPCSLPKCIKNSVEVENAIKAHELDGLALTKFLFWLEKSLQNKAKITEIDAEEKLLEFRKQSPEFIYPSFASISSFASNGAIIHYQATKETDKEISGNSLYLIDSGGQYFCGTTDVTRTILVGEAKVEHIENFTRVLKGHITLASTKFPQGLTGSHLDVLARRFLWQDGKDYDHGTGHGVGSFLSVHEGPISISKRSSQEFLENMILSNEPGFYQEGDYGIRIENLMLVQKHQNGFLGFKTLTLAPIDFKLIDFKMLTYPERKWLFLYHQEILLKLESNLNIEERKWLQGFVDTFETKFKSASKN